MVVGQLGFLSLYNTFLWTFCTSELDLISVKKNINKLKDFWNTSSLFVKSRRNIKIEQKSIAIRRTRIRIRQWKIKK